MTARIVGAELPATDFRESFPARDLKVGNDPEKSHAVAKSVRYIHCAECGATFYRPSEDWAYKIYDMDYDRAKGFVPERNWWKHAARIRYFCSYHCFRTACRIAEEFTAKAEAERLARKKIYWAECEFCHGAFETARRNARFCCADHRDKAANARAAQKARERREAERRAMEMQKPDAFPWSAVLGGKP